MNNILEVTEKCHEIAAGPPVTCKECGEQWFSVFDKLFIAAYGMCVDCIPGEEFELMTDNIFEIIEAMG